MAIVTNSERSSASCPQRWLLRYGLGIRPVGRVRVLDLGSLIHEGLDAYFTAPADRVKAAWDAIDALRDSEILGHVSAQRDAGLGGFDPETYVSDEDIAGIRSDAETAQDLLRSYDAHWGADEYEVLLSEETLVSPVRTPIGRRSPATSYGGKIDKVVRWRGKTYIMEHKTTSTPLFDWVERNRRSPQAKAYAWLLRETRGIEVDGVLWDLVQTKPPKPWDELPVLKSGNRLGKTAGLPWTTADQFLRAVETVGAVEGNPGTLADADWYQSTYDALLTRDQSGFWFRREIELIDWGIEIQRIESELYTAATEIRRWRDTVDAWHNSPKLTDASPGEPEYVTEALSGLSGKFPRESGICWQYNRLCPYAAICGSHSPDDLYGMTITDARFGHTELNLPQAGGTTEEENGN